MAGLLASIVNEELGKMIPVADFGLSSLVAVTGDVSQTTTVVAFLTLAAVLCHVAYMLEDIKGHKVPNPPQA